MTDRADGSRSRRIDAAIAEYLESIESGTPFDRAAFLARHPDLADELDQFITDYRALEPAARRPDLIPAPTLTAPRRVGDYELLEEIGRGGMGVVYRARQISLDRIVAVKMILSGRLASQAEVARFYAEAHAAATLDHPNIVPVFEVGRLDGQHFFSMGYVAGHTLSDQLLDGPFKPREAAAVMRDVAAAVDFAHRKGIIHRDIKPANVLIDADRRVRITDFGLASSSAADSHLTVTGQMLGSPNFMSPEQVSGRKAEIGPVADVYSLGATLYALLTGRPPFQAASTVEVLKQVIEKDPVPLRQLDASLPRDLETITLKCLEKDRARRYPTAVALANDLQRFLDGRPVTAVAPSKLYDLGKFARRNKPLVTAAVAVVAALAGGVTMLSIGLSRARSESRRANDALLQAQQINDFLTDLLTRASPLYDGTDTGHDATIREALDTAARQIDRSFADQPKIEMALRETMGSVYEALGLKADARKHYARSVELSRTLGVDSEPGGLRRQVAFMRMLPSVESAAAAIPQAQALADECMRRLGPDDPVTIESLDALGGAYGLTHRLDDARAVFKQALARTGKNVAQDPETHLHLSLGYASALRDCGQLRESIDVLESFLPLLRRSPGSGGRVDYVRFLASIGSIYYDLHDATSAEKYYRQAVDAAVEQGGPNHHNAVVFTHWLARTLYDQKKFDEAERLERDAWSRSVRLIGSENPTTLEMTTTLALILDNSGKLAEAEPFFRDVVQVRRRTVPDDDLLRIQSVANLAGNLEKQKRPAEAIPLLLEVYTRRDLFRKKGNMDARIAGDLGLALCEVSRFSDAEPYLRESVALRQERRMPMSKTSRRIFESLADICENTGRADEAAKLRATATQPPTSQPS